MIVMIIKWASLWNLKISLNSDQLDTCFRETNCSDSDIRRELMAKENSDRFSNSFQFNLGNRLKA